MCFDPDITLGFKLSSGNIRATRLGTGRLASLPQPLLQPQDQQMVANQAMRLMQGQSRSCMLISSSIGVKDSQGLCISTT